LRSSSSDLAAATVSSAAHEKRRFFGIAVEFLLSIFLSLSHSLTHTTTNSLSLPSAQGVVYINEQEIKIDDVFVKWHNRYLFSKMFSFSFTFLSAFGLRCHPARRDQEEAKSFTLTFRELFSSSLAVRY